MKNAIMLADTRVATIGTLLLQIVEKSPNTFDEAIIYHNGISDTDKEVLQKIMPCVFIEYKCPIDVKEFNQHIQKMFGTFTLARYDIFDLIKNYNTIIWLDTDIVIKKSLDNLIELSKKHPILLLQESLGDPYKKDTFTLLFPALVDIVPNYDLLQPMLNPCLLVVSNSLEQKVNYTKWCYDETLKYANKLQLPDLAIINFLIQNFDINFHPLMHGEYGLFPKNGNEIVDCSIVHSWGSSKFWNNTRLYKQYPLWGECYHKWVDLGGSTMDLPELEISVVIPSFNPNLKYFKECMDSLLNQCAEWDLLSYDNFEIIIIIEPFNTKEKEAEFIKFIKSYKDDRIIYKINEQCMGISASLNQGMKLAKGKYIMRMDDDDIAMPRRMFLQKKYLDQHNDIHLCTCDHFFFDESNEYRVGDSGELAKALSLITCPLTHPTVLFRKQWFEENNLIYSQQRFFGEDWDMWNRAFDAGMKVGNVPSMLLKYRYHGMQASRGDINIQTVIIIIFERFSRLGIVLNQRQARNLSLHHQELTPLYCLDIYYIFIKLLKANKKTHLYDQQALKKAVNMRMNKALHNQIIDKPIWYAILRMIAKRIKNKTLFWAIKHDIKKLLGYIIRK